MTGLKERYFMSIPDLKILYYKRLMRLIHVPEMSFPASSYSLLSSVHNYIVGIYIAQACWPQN